MVDFDGIWIDMNEASNFCNGEYPNDCPSNNNFEASLTPLLLGTEYPDPGEFAD